MRQLDSRALGSFAAASDTGEVTRHSVLDGGAAQPAHEEGILKPRERLSSDEQCVRFWIMRYRV